MKVLHYIDAIDVSYGLNDAVINAFFLDHVVFAKDLRSSIFLKNRMTKFTKSSPI
jgi:hypothetical protein